MEKKHPGPVVKAGKASRGKLRKIPGGRNLPSQALVDPEVRRPWVYRAGVVSAAESARLFEEIRAIVETAIGQHGQPKVIIAGQAFEQRRRVAYFSRTRAAYTYSGAQPPNAGWPPVAQRLADLASRLVQESLAGDSTTAIAHDAKEPSLADIASRLIQESLASDAKMGTANDAKESTSAPPAPRSSLHPSGAASLTPLVAAAPVVFNPLVAAAPVVFDSILANYYRNGSDNIGRHSDKVSTNFRSLLHRGLIPTGTRANWAVRWLAGGNDGMDRVV
jgi:hypothetical protein